MNKRIAEMKTELEHMHILHIQKKINSIQEPTAEDTKEDKKPPTRVNPKDLNTHK